MDFTPAQVRETLLNLTTQDYCRGPFIDSEIVSGEVCEFGVEVDGKEIYIKLAVVEKYNLHCCKCISFHKAERPMEYPLKGSD